MTIDLIPIIILKIKLSIVLNNNLDIMTGIKFIELLSYSKQSDSPHKRQSDFSIHINKLVEYII